MPQTSQNFLGHEDIWQYLEQAWTENRLPHALLFAGPEGVGKQQVARCLAIRLLQSSENLEQHPDFYLIEPENNRIKIDMIRELKKGLPFAPLKANCRVVLINDAHTMNTAAANALLKSLEEPPTGTYFILITHAMGWLPNTIVSRCQKLNFHPLTETQLELLLKEQNIAINDNHLKQAQGSLAKAKQLSEVATELPELRRLLPSSQTLDFLALQKLAEQIVDEGKLEAFLNGLLSATHQVLTGARKNQKYDFDLIHFADRVVALKNGLRLNLNAKLQLTRLLLHFQEAKESRL